MKHSAQVFFTNTIEDPWLEDESDELDEIDELFSQLLHIDPPATLVNNILASVAALPLSQETNAAPEDIWEGLTIHDPKP